MDYLLAILLFGAVATPQSILHVYVLFDPDHDGIDEGVGPGVPVWVGKAGNETLNFTDENSRASYLVEPGVWLARAQPPPTRPFFVWVCGGYKDVEDAVESLILHCYERFFLRFPWLTIGAL